MKFATFLKKNLQWNFSKNHFDFLIGETTTEEQLSSQLAKLSERYYPQRQKVETVYTEFCLNDIAMKHAKTNIEKLAIHCYCDYWNKFLRLKKAFNANWATFPSNGKTTRLEEIATLVINCTQNTADNYTMHRICETIRSTFDLEDRENRNLENVLRLYSINHFCAICNNIFDKKTNAEKRLAQTMSVSLKTDFEKNNNLRHAYYFNKKICANVDCLGNSATKYNVATKIDVQTRLFVRGRNVFDTFCHSKFGKNTAEFYSQSPTLHISMQYFLNETKEIRHYIVKNLGKTKALQANFTLTHTDTSVPTTYFPEDNALCLSVGNDFYCALAVVVNGKTAKIQFQEGKITHVFDLPEDKDISFDLVTVYADNSPNLHEQLQQLDCFGTTKCPFSSDTPSTNCVSFSYPLSLSTHGYMMKAPEKHLASTLKFSYQFGNGVASFLDNDGNCTTLLNGFPFGIGGEKVFAVKNGIISQLNCGNFSFLQDICYSNTNGSICIVSHDKGKFLSVRHPTPQRTLFYFPLEDKMQVEKVDNTFTLHNDVRQFTIRCVGDIESFTTNALECNEQRLRYKLSNNITCGTCLVICIGSNTSARIDIERQSVLPVATPLVQESLTSTYLNCVNEKNVFCLQNHLKRADSLTVAAIVFTNPNFVKEYLTTARKPFFYDSTGQKKNYFDRLTLPLTAVYYAVITNDNDFWNEKLKNEIYDVIFGQTFTDFELCIKALILKRAAQLKIFDKMRCLVEYNNVKQIITSSPKLFCYAQAIGAVPLIHPSKERLKDLCNQYNIPKSWYYVSQLENLYGLSFYDGALRFQPKVTQDNVLEQLSLRVADKRINTTFLKSTVQSMTLNGTQYYAAFKPQNLKKEDNTLVVRY